MSVKIKNIFEHEELLNQPVHCVLHGNGFIVGFDFDSTLPVKCAFDNTKAEDANSTVWFTNDGRCYNDSPPTLSFGHKVITEFSYGTPFIKPQPLKLTKLDWANSNILKYYIAHNQAYESKPYIVKEVALNRTLGADYYTEADARLIAEHLNNNQFNL